MASSSSSSDDDSVVGYVEHPSVIPCHCPRESLCERRRSGGLRQCLYPPDLGLPEGVGDDGEDADDVNAAAAVDTVDAGDVGDSEGMRPPLSDNDNCLAAGLEDLSVLFSLARPNSHSTLFLFTFSLNAMTVDGFYCCWR
ncbi:hypothetical protein MRX96_012899 [Rhipicephalus microplus]